MQTPNIIVEDSDLSAVASDPVRLLPSDVVKECAIESFQAALCRIAVTTFIAQTSLSGQNPQVLPDKSVDEQARTVTKDWDLGGFSPRLFNAGLNGSIGIATIAYGHTPTAVQLYITLYTTVAFAVDDGACTAEALFAFADKMHYGVPQLHPLLDRYVGVLQDMRKFYSAFGVKMIVRSTLDFVNSVPLEKHVSDMAIHPSAQSYVNFKRAHNGIGDAYTAFIWDKFNFPDVSTYLQAFP